jgi:pimeloyl-ACP methyl ester carboxylesterase
MDGFVAPLVARGMRVVAFDQPAHGVSSGRRATIDDMANATVGVARIIGPLHGVIGHSLGATATAIALARGMKAERAALFAPAAEVQHFVRRFASAVGLSDDVTAEMLAILRRELGGDFDAVDVRLLAHRLHAKALVLHDPKDAEVPFDHGRAIADAWPGAELRRLDGLGHNRPIRHRETIEEAVRFVAAEVAS